jgi:hypothetical protein
MFRACGNAETIVADTSVTYNPITDSMESGTLWFWQGPTKHVVKGIRGNATLMFTAQGIPYIEFDLVGIYAAPADAAQATPTLDAWQKPEIVSKAKTPTFSVNGVSLVMRSCSLTLNGQVEPRLLVGVERVIIVDRAELISITVEATPLATFNPYALAEAQTSIALSLVHGTNAGAIATLSAPQCQLKRPNAAQQQQGVVEWPLELVPLPDEGNDQWSLALT